MSTRHTVNHIVLATKTLDFEGRLRVQYVIILNPKPKTLHPKPVRFGAQGLEALDLCAAFGGTEDSWTCTAFYLQ